MSEQSPVFHHDGEDPAIEQAAKRARQTFRYFWREVAWDRRRIIPALEFACVKIAFRDPPGRIAKDVPEVEQMWVSDVDFDGQQLTGTLINQPNWLRSVKEGDCVTIRPSQLNDWMYSIEGKAYGGFSVSAMRAQMGRKERAAHDAAWGVDFGEPGKVAIIPYGYVHPQEKKGLLSKFLNGGNKVLDMAEVEAAEHPFDVNMSQSLQEHLSKDPSAVTAADENGFTLLHSLVLAGSTKGVEVLISHGADVNQPVKNGLRPLQLAKAIGWRKVHTLLMQHGAK